MSDARAEIAAPFTKAAGAWTLVGASAMTPQEWASLIASILAAIYTLLLLGEWVWKRVFVKERRKKARE